MRPLVAVRRAVAFDPSFMDRHRLFWPLARAAKALGEHADFPPVEALGRVFEASPPVRFVAALPRPRRGRRAAERELYDERITVDGEVPTRSRCWHDLMNALVWGTFPRAKQALHARQHRAISERIDRQARTLPATRSRELDALALLDEGGVAILAGDTDALRAAAANDRASFRAWAERAGARPVVFGHAIYESLAFGVKPAIVAAIVLRGGGTGDVVAETDRLLCQAIADPGQLQSPGELMRLDLGDADVRSVVDGECDHPNSRTP
jgi:hypothetical protein